METTSSTKRAKASLLMVLLLLASATSAANTQRDGIQCILVEKAKIARASLAKEGKFGRANLGHQIIAGTKSVLAIRIYEGENGPVDSQSFEKATVEFEMLADAHIGEEATVNVLRSYYANGSSGWVHKGEYWWAENPFPRVHFRRDSRGLHATLKSTVNATYAAKIFPRPPETISVDVTCRVRKLPVLQLTPWTGRAGTDWLSFYPQNIDD